MRLPMVVIVCRQISSMETGRNYALHEVVSGVVSGGGDVAYAAVMWMSGLT